MTINLPLPYDRSRLRRNAILSRIKFGAWDSKPLPTLFIKPSPRAVCKSIHLPARQIGKSYLVEYLRSINAPSINRRCAT